MEQKRTRKVNIRARIFQALFVLAMLFLMATVTFSWFTNGDHASVSGIQMNVVEPERMKVTVGESTSADGTLQLNFDQDKPLAALSGNGMCFYTPKIMKDEKGNLFANTDQLMLAIAPGSGVESYADGGAYAIDFTVNASSASTLCLYGQSQEQKAGIFPAPKDEYAKEWEGLDPGHICGAMRIAILQKNPDGEYVTKLIWAPDVTTTLTPNGSSFSVSQGAAQNSMVVRGFGEDPKEAVTINGNCTQNGITYVFGALQDKVPVGDPMQLTEQTETETEQDADLPYAGEYRLVIWVDGEDRECHNVLMDGLVKVILYLGL